MRHGCTLSEQVREANELREFLFARFLFRVSLKDSIVVTTTTTSCMLFQAIWIFLTISRVIIIISAPPNIPQVENQRRDKRIESASQ